ncbi:zinc ribbon domain-containing protein [Ruficoccus amylovorans]|uniref:Zinc ribbon domain-containing protein n=1 Tax=Ruficoccus amylovorans TaxID=1804625 RepID=A0A842HAD8_9BACT|nr:zinc ribbon domain-containing protein [Ruficoccus amylovorans]MBC2593058.1 zinc ribbon domain-containing protein [Ruficoccus amylovorans]
MPIYVYEVITGDGSSGERFEIEQPMSAAPLTQHPRTGQPVRRVYLPPNLGSKYTPGSTQNKLSNENVEKAGFTRYERDKLTGTYHKVAGKDSAAPDTLKP